MARQQNPNIDLLTIAVDRLGPLADEMVFVGGCATGLLITDPAAPSVRVTVDVDVITEVATLGDYYQLAERLRQRQLERIPDHRITFGQIANGHAASLANHVEAFLG